MNKIQFEKVLKPLLEIYGQIERDIINNIASKFLNYSSVDGTLEWYLEKLKDIGTIDNETMSFIKKNKKDILKILRNITNFGTTVDNIEVLSNYYEKGLIDVNPFLLNKSTSISNLINEALKDCTDITNLIDSKVLEGTEAAYKNIINKAYIETASGVYTYQESIRRALKEFAKDGIKTVHYASGKTLGIESVVRRDVVTRVNKLVGDSTIEHCKTLNTNMVYVDQHYGARVRTPYMKNDYEAHAEWQGKKYLIEGSSDEYKNLYETTGYGEMLGLKGINCYHNFRPTWEWEEIPKQIDEKQNKEEYELLQKQRAYERKIRQLKREKGIAKDFYSKEEQKALNKRYKTVNEDFDSFLDSNNLTRDYSREYILNNKNINELSFIGYKKDGNYSNEEIKKMTQQLNNMLNKYVDLESSWSGNIVIRDKGPSGMLWNGDIITKNETSPHELLHELIHLKSLNLNDNGIYIKEIGLEEIPVQLLTQEISLKEGIEIIPSKYDNMVNKLKKVNQIAKISQNDYLFAKDIIKRPVSERYNWLTKQIKDERAINLINEIRDDELWKKRL